MVNIPDSLQSVFTSTVRQKDDSYLFEVPSSEINLGGLSPGETYRVAIVETTTTVQNEEEPTRSSKQSQRHSEERAPQPPVEEGEIREVTIEDVGEEGDGIAKVDRGYVVIVPDADPGDEAVVEIDRVHENVAFATVVDRSLQTR